MIYIQFFPLNWLEGVSFGHVLNSPAQMMNICTIVAEVYIIWNCLLAGYPRFNSIWAEQNRSEIRTITLNDSGNNGLFGWIDNAGENKNEIPNWSWLLVETNDNDK